MGHITPKDAQRMADICLITEGAYPFVRGGVATWMHELILSQPDKTFHLVTVVPQTGALNLAYEIPDNVISQTVYRLNHLPEGEKKVRFSKTSDYQKLTQGLLDLLDGGDLKTFETCYKLIRKIGGENLLNGPKSWDMITKMYQETLPNAGFAEFFWAWRSLFGGLFSMMLPPLPQAKVYHTIATGYSGLIAARAKLETGRPCLITEHGIYTNERRIEFFSSTWLNKPEDFFISSQIQQQESVRQMKELWIEAFTSYSKVCYESCEEIFTLYPGNQPDQVRDGADPARLRIIPNGIDTERFENLRGAPKVTGTPTIALIGRIVPIKDIKTFLYACAQLRDKNPNFKALIMGPTSEDLKYAEECTSLCTYLGLDDVVTFTGMVNILEYLPDIDIQVLTSLSEVQPLVILEAGAAGIPSVTTRVGHCEGMIMGDTPESKKLGAGGFVVPLGNPPAIADALHALISDPALYKNCSEAIRERVHKYFRKEQQREAYTAVYDHWLAEANKQNNNDEVA